MRQDASQHRFLCHAKDLMEVLLLNGNPFEEHNGDMVTLENQVYESAAAAVSVNKVYETRAIQKLQT